MNCVSGCYFHKFITITISIDYPEPPTHLENTSEGSGTTWSRTTAPAPLSYETTWPLPYVPRCERKSAETACSWSNVSQALNTCCRTIGVALLAVCRCSVPRAGSVPCLLPAHRSAYFIMSNIIANVNALVKSTYQPLHHFPLKFCHA